MWFFRQACADTAGVRAQFASADVLSDDKIRQGIKDFSNWPTIPQLYVNGEFVGGSDIVTEMYESGELQAKLETVANRQRGVESVS